MAVKNPLTMASVILKKNKILTHNHLAFRQNFFQCGINHAELRFTKTTKKRLECLIYKPSRLYYMVFLQFLLDVLYLSSRRILLLSLSLRDSYRFSSVIKLSLNFFISSKYVADLSISNNCIPYQYNFILQFQNHP